MDSRVSTVSGLPGGTEYTDKQTTEAEKRGTVHEQRVFANINGRKWLVTSTPTPCIKLCGVCMADRLTSKSVCDNRAHTVCDECEPKTLLNGECHFCQGNIPNEAQRQIANDNLTCQLNRVELECQECPWKGTYRDIAVHILHCRKTHASCEYFSMGCQHKGTRSDLKDHQLSCPYKPVATLPLATHKEQCKKRPVTEGNLTTTYLTEDALTSHPRSVPSTSNTSNPYVCRLCSQCFESMAHLRGHYSYCPLIFVSCYYDGCRSRMPYRELEVHMESCNYKPQGCECELKRIWYS